MRRIRSKLSLAKEFKFHDIKLKKLFWKCGPGFKLISFDNKMRMIGSQSGTCFFSEWHQV